MKKKNIHFQIIGIIICTLFLIMPVCLFSDTIGHITSLHGMVTIDTFGKNTFIEALKGDLLYNETILSFSPGSNITLDLKNTPVTIASTEIHQLIVQFNDRLFIHFSQHSITLSELVELNKDNVYYTEHNISIALQIIGEILDNLFSHIDTQVYSTKEFPRGMEWEWVLDYPSHTDSSIVKTALQHYKDYNYSGLLHILTKIKDIPDNGFPAGGAAFLKGICYFKLHRYTKAKEEIALVHQQTGHGKKADLTFHINSLLYYVSGILSYITGEYTETIDSLSLYLDYCNREKKKMNLSVYSLYTSSCIKLNQHEKAENFLTNAIDESTNNLLKEELEKILNTIPSHETSH